MAAGIVSVRECDDHLFFDLAVFEKVDRESDGIPEGGLWSGHSHLGFFEEDPAGIVMFVRPMGGMVWTTILGEWEENTKYDSKRYKTMFNVSLTGI